MDMRIKAMELRTAVEDYSWDVDLMLGALIDDFEKRGQPHLASGLIDAWTCCDREEEAKGKNYINAVLEQLSPEDEFYGLARDCCEEMLDVCRLKKEYADLQASKLLGV